MESQPNTPIPANLPQRTQPPQQHQQHQPPQRSLKRRLSYYFRRNRKLVRILVVLVIIFVVWFVFIKADKPAVKSQDIPTITGVSINHPNSWQVKKLSKAEVDAGIIAKLSKTSPDTSFILRTLRGKLAADFSIKTLPDQLVTIFKEQKPGFELTEKKLTTLGKYEAVQLRYSFKNDDYLMSVLPTPNNTYYLTFWAKKGQLTPSLPEIDQINSSIADYATAHQ